jgi:hypothetical protein
MWPHRVLALVRIYIQDMQVIYIPVLNKRLEYLKDTGELHSGSTL